MRGGRVEDDVHRLDKTWFVGQVLEGGEKVSTAQQ
jgi:hypothetical protein